MSKSQRLLADLEASTETLVQGLPTLATRRIYGNRVVNRLIKTGTICERSIDIGNGFYFDVFVLEETS